MNYRHQFHAGNFADVWKHALLLPLIRGMQRKEKGFLFLDTHAGRGTYDLSLAARGDSLERKPEFPEGIGRLWDDPGLPADLRTYVAVVKTFNQRMGGTPEAPHFYPGSPWLAQLSLRPQDRLAACELQEDEFRILKYELGHELRVSLHQLDGYTAIRAMLPPSEKRALVLIDPPFETKDEFRQLYQAVDEGLRRMPAATFAIWYPLTGRSRAEEFLDEFARAVVAPCFAAEVAIAGEASAIKLRGCGLLVVNPPWQIDRVLKPLIEFLSDRLAVEPGGGGRLRWLVREK